MSKVSINYVYLIYLLLSAFKITGSLQSLYKIFAFPGVVYLTFYDSFTLLEVAISLSWVGSIYYSVSFIWVWFET